MMRRFGLALAFSLLLLGNALAQGGMGPGPGTVHSTGGGGGYTGPGDVNSGALLWYGLRAYSSATRGNNLINVCNVSDVACVDMASDATTGDLVITTVGGSDCSVVTCTIKTFYNQGSTGSAPMTKTTIAERYKLQTSCSGSLPCARSPTLTTLQGYNGAFSFTQASPYTVSFAAKRTAANTTRGVLMGEATSNLFFTGFRNATNSMEIFSTSSANATATDNVFHAVQAIFNGASSNIFVNGTANSVSVTANNLSAVNVGLFRNASLSAPLQGDAFEVGFWAGAWTTSGGGQADNMHNNQCTYWGFTC